jgi:alpha-acetolactate decarboxylase
MLLDAAYAKSLNMPGYHFHFLSIDHRHGGHLLECRGRNLTLQGQREAALHFALLETVDLLKPDLSRDPTKALDFARRRITGRRHERRYNQEPLHNEGRVRDGGLHPDRDGLWRTSLRT